MTETPMSRPGEVAGWPKLTVEYRTDPAGVEQILPPGLTAGEPIVTVGVYCVPVLGEPEYGVSVKVPASWKGVSGQYSLGLGIDQEAAIFISGETNGQPKYPCDIRFYRLGNRVEARTIHQGYTFIEFEGDVTGAVDPKAGQYTEHEWWTKYSRAIGGGARKRSTTSRPTSWMWPPPSSKSMLRTSTASCGYWTAPGTPSPAISPSSSSCRPSW